MNMKDIKKECLKGKIEISDHALLRIDKRGYVVEDVYRCILTGNIYEKQVHKREPSVLVLGDDLDGLPIVVIITKNILSHHYKVITVMPPIDNKRFNRVI